MEEKKNSLGLTEEETDKALEDLTDITTIRDSMQEAEDWLDDIEDFDVPETQVNYEIWLVADDENDCATDFEVMLDDGYTEQEEAYKCFNYFTNASEVKAYLNSKAITIPTEVKHLYLRLEAVIEEGPDMMACNELVDEKEIEIL